MNNKGLILNNKGFTLIELLAVITILLAFSVVVVTNVSASLKKGNTKNENLQKTLAITAAKIYFSNEKQMKNGELVCIDDLVTHEYVDYDSVDMLYRRRQCVKLKEDGYVIESCHGACK